MWQIGHRGYPDKYGDNNMVSFLKAAEAGFDMIELDVQLCKTGEIVVFHDTWFNDKYILDTPYEDLAKYDMVLLEDVFQEFAHTRMMLFLDIKGTPDIVHPLVRLIDIWFSRGDMHRIYVSGFNRGFVADLLQYNLRINVGFTTENMFTLDQLDMLCDRMSYICLHWTALDADVIAHLHKKGILVFAYTCKDNFILNHMLDYDLDGIVANYLVSGGPPVSPVPPAKQDAVAGKELFDVECLGNLEFEGDGE